MKASSPIARITGNVTATPGFATVAFTSPSGAHGVCHDPWLNLATNVQTPVFLL